MKRKLSKIGPTTLMVSIPHLWVKQNNLKKGDEIEIIEEKDKLILGTSVKHSSKEITLIIPSIEDYLVRFILAPYVKGYDMIIVKYKDSRVYERVLETSRQLIGFEVVENTSESCKIVNISSALEQKFDILLRRLFAATYTFGKELSERLKESNDCQDLLEYETNINRINLFCKRVLQIGAAGETFYSPLSLYAMVKNLEESADCFRMIVEQIARSTQKVNKVNLLLFSQCLRLIEINSTLFNKITSGEKITNQLYLFKEHKKIRKGIQTNENNLKGDLVNQKVHCHLLALAELSYHLGEELFY